ncbi:MAG: histidine kinase [Oscillospiraceae bacterium]|nr:histidine kinase [Oscillospiraceae bacterium]
MKLLTDKLIVCLLCFICFAASSDITQLSVISLLCAVIVSCAASMATSFKSKKTGMIVFGAVHIFYLALCFRFPLFTWLIPLLIYDFIKTPFAPACIPYAAAFITASETYSVRDIFLWMLIVFTAAYLRYGTRKETELEDALIETRDMITEKNLALGARNKALEENQEYEVKLATLKERNRIAGDIHDNVGHMLSRTILQTGALLVLEKDETKHEALESINSSLNQAMTSIRQSVHDLHNDSIDLSSAVFEAVSALPSGINRSIECDKIETMPQNIKFCFISVIKEAISNIIRHSNADHVTVILREHPAFYQLLIRDNGSISANSSDTGMGLVNMRSRIESLGGSFTSDNEDGYKIFISIPKKGE